MIKILDKGESTTKLVTQFGSKKQLLAIWEKGSIKNEQFCTKTLAETVKKQ